MPSDDPQTIRTRGAPNELSRDVVAVGRARLVMLASDDAASCFDDLCVVVEDVE